MREYIFRFEQSKLVELKLNMNEVLLLDYMLRFFEQDYLKVKLQGEEHYFKLTYNKIISDLPILNIKKRQLSNILQNLENKGILKRYKYNHNEMYLSVLFDELLCNKLQCSIDSSAKNCIGVCNKLPTIESYNSKNIKIIKIECPRVNYINLELYNIELQKNLQSVFGYNGKPAYELFMKETVALDYKDGKVYLSVKWKDHLEKYYNDRFEKVVKDTFELFNV